MPSRKNSETKKAKAFEAFAQLLGQAMEEEKREREEALEAKLRANHEEVVRLMKSLGLKEPSKLVHPLTKKPKRNQK